MRLCSCRRIEIITTNRLNIMNAWKLISSSVMSKVIQYFLNFYLSRCKTQNSTLHLPFLYERWGGAFSTSNCMVKSSSNFCLHETKTLEHRNNLLRIYKWICSGCNYLDAITLRNQYCFHDKYHERLYATFKRNQVMEKLDSYKIIEENKWKNSEQKAQMKKDNWECVHSIYE